MRLAALTAVALLAIALTGCASAPSSTGPDDLDRLRASCTERGGILVPSGGPFTGRVETDNVCNITGGASRIR